MREASESARGHLKYDRLLVYPHMLFFYMFRWRGKGWRECRLKAGDWGGGKQHAWTERKIPARFTESKELKLKKEHTHTLAPEAISATPGHLDPSQKIAHKRVF